MNTPKPLLYLILVVCGITVYYSYKTLKTVERLADEYLSPEYAETDHDVAPDVTDHRKMAKRGGIEVSSTYRIEDRYVASYSGIRVPEYLGDQEGQVVVNISVGKSGDVKKTSINNASTITDPEVLESARKAALKTNFNINMDAPSLQAGTITYTFNRK